MLLNKRADAVKASKVKGRADEFMVAEIQVRAEDLLVNACANTAADLGKLCQNETVLDARRAVLRVHRQWHPFILDTPEFMVAVSRIVVNPDGRGSTAPGAVI